MNRCLTGYYLTIMNPYLDLTGRVALVTGASSGIGAATAVTLADLGAKVALSYHRNRQGAEETRDRIVAAGGTAIALAADVRRAEDIRALVAARERRARTDRHPRQQRRLARRPVRHPRDHRGTPQRDRGAQLHERRPRLAGGRRLDDRAQARRHHQRRVDRRPQRRRPRRQPLRLVQGRAHVVHQGRSPRNWRRRASASTPSRRASSTRPSTRCSPRRR